MKYIVIFALLFFHLTVQAITIIDGEKQFTIGIEDLNRLDTTEIEIQRRGDGRIEKYKGVLISHLLSTLKIEKYNQLKFLSFDNYQVRLTLDNIIDKSPLIALQRNDQLLSEDELRLIVPGMRSMYWIDGVSSMETESYQKMISPDVIFFAEDLIANLPYIEDSDLSNDKREINFLQLLSLLYPVLQEEFIFISRDGISHRLDIEKYLLNAVLTIDDAGYTLQSVDLPTGMWIKSLAYIQFFDRAIIFRNQFTNLSEVKELADWSSMPQTLSSEMSGNIPTEFDFSNPIWLHSGRLKWQK